MKEELDEIEANPDDDQSTEDDRHQLLATSTNF